MSIRVAIAGVGNCASSLVQGVEYYKDTKDEDKIPGLMHNNFGGYRVRDIEFVTAFDVDALKVGKDLSEAIGASQNNTIKFADVPNLGRYGRWLRVRELPAGVHRLRSGVGAEVP